MKRLVLGFLLVVGVLGSGPVEAAGTWDALKAEKVIRSSCSGVFIAQMEKREPTPAEMEGWKLCRMYVAGRVHECSQKTSNNLLDQAIFKFIGGSDPCTYYE